MRLQLPVSINNKHLLLSLSLLLNLVLVIYITCSKPPIKDNILVQASPLQLGDNQPLLKAPLTDNRITLKAHEKTSATSVNKMANKPTIKNNPLFNLIDAANEAFDQLNFFLAFQLLSDIQTINESSAIKLQSQWLTKAYDWLTHKRYLHIQKLLDNAFIYFPHDESWQLVYIELLLALDNPLKAIDIYREIILNTFDINKEENLVAQLHKLAKKTLQSLESENQWSSIIELATQLLLDDPNYPPYLFALANAYSYTDSPEHALPFLQQIEHINEYRHKINQIYNKIYAQNDLNKVKLLKLNDHFIVNTTLNQRLSADLMIDTGASLTVISSLLYEELQNTVEITRGRTVRLQTAGGEKQAFSIIINEFAVGDFLLNNFEVVVLDISDLSGADGLLGMNFLKRFKFSIDQENAFLFLEDFTSS